MILPQKKLTANSQENLFEGLKFRLIDSSQIGRKDLVGKEDLSQRISSVFFQNFAESIKENIGQLTNKQAVKRAPFQNLSNDEHTQKPKPKRKVPLAYSKKKNMAKSLIKEKSIIIKAEQQKIGTPQESSLSKQPQKRQQKSFALLLSEELQKKIKDLNDKLTNKIIQIKIDLQQKRSTSVSLPKHRSTLKAHLQRKPTQPQNHHQVKECYMKFIPMKDILCNNSGPIINQKIIKSKLMDRLTTQFRA